MGKVIALPNAVNFGADALVERVTITPALATEWLKANNHNRPLAKTSPRRTRSIC